MSTTTYTIADDLIADVNAQRAELLTVAPDADELRARVAAWSDLMDRVIIDIEVQISAHRGPHLSTLVRWSGAWADAYYDPDDWGSYGVFVGDAPVSITVVS